MVLNSVVIFVDKVANGESGPSSSTYSFTYIDDWISIIGTLIEVAMCHQRARISITVIE